MGNPSSNNFESIYRHHVFGYPHTEPSDRERATAPDEIRDTLRTHSDCSVWPIRLARPADMDTLLLGMYAQSMDEKWNVWADGPTDGQILVHMARSWTGYKIAQLRLTATRDEETGQWTPETGRVTKFVWSTDAEMVNWDKDEAMKQARGVLTYVMGIEMLNESEQAGSVAEESSV